MQGRLCWIITWESAGKHSLYSKRNRDTWDMVPYAGADYNLTLPHSRLQQPNSQIPYGRGKASLKQG